MCAGAAYWTRLARIVYGARDEKRGFSQWHSPAHRILHPTTVLEGGVLEAECSQLVRSFFQARRK
jgi:tRNA(adenine34) deaminase